MLDCENLSDSGFGLLAGDRFLEFWGFFHMVL